MVHQHLLGKMPTYESGPNKGRLNRDAAALQWGITKEELHKIYNNWVQTFRFKESTLTFEQYLLKMDEASITPNQIGHHMDEQYHLSRYGDIGPYTNDSCRFVVKRANLAEQKRVSIKDRLIHKHGVERAKEIMSENGRRGRAMQGHSGPAKNR